jgi:hypothetical protein
MRILVLILTVMAVFLLMAPASPQDKVNPSRKNQAEKSAKKIKELQKERIAILKGEADQITKLFQMGRVSFEEVYEAKRLLLMVELVAAEQESDRITLYKNTVGELKKIENFAEAKVKSGRGTQASAVKVKAGQINLEQAKAKEAKEAK